MPILDALKLIEGAKKAGLRTVYEFIKYCDAHNLHTNAERLAHFTK